MPERSVRPRQLITEEEGLLTVVSDGQEPPSIQGSTALPHSWSVGHGPGSISRTWSVVRSLSLALQRPCRPFPPLLHRCCPLWVPMVSSLETVHPVVSLKLLFSGLFLFMYVCCIFFSSHTRYPWYGCFFHPFTFSSNFSGFISLPL